MRKNRTKHEAKKPRLAKRALALCFALIFVCSCLLPAFANSEAGALAGTAVVEEQDEQKLEDSAPLNEGGTDSTEGNEEQDEQKQEEANASKETSKELTSSSSGEASGESQSTAPSESASSEDSASTAPGESASSSSASSSASSEQPAASSSASSEEPAASSASSSEAASSSASASSTVTSGDVINQGEAVYTYRFWTKEIDAFDLEQVNLAVNNGENLIDAAKSVTGIAPCEVLKVANHAHLADYTVTEPTKDGYVFAGWYTLEDGTAYEFSFDQNVSFEKSKTIDVFAKWEKVESTVEDEMEKTEPTTEDELEKTESSKDSESKEETLPPVEKTGEVGLTNNKGDTVSIAVKAENLPSKVKELVVTDLNEDEEGAAFGNALAASSYTDWTVTNLMVNITPKDAEGNTVEPNEAVTVHFSGLESLMIQYSSEMNLKVLHMKRDGTLEALSLKNVQTKETQEGTVLSSFAVSTTSFSPFVLAASESASIEPASLTLESYKYGKTLTRGESIVIKSDWDLSVFGYKWHTSDSTALKIVEEGTDSSGKPYARVKALKATGDDKVTIRYSDHSSWNGSSYKFSIENSRDDQTADIFFLKTPNTGADSNSEGYWLPTDGNEDWTVNGVQFEGKINTAGAKWDTNNKNIMLTDRDNATGTYVLSWPDGSTQKTWTLYRNCTDTVATEKGIQNRQTNQVAFSTILNMIWDAYKEELAKDLKVDADTLDSNKITEITLIPYKISTNDTMHIDCTISATGLAYQARFWVQDAESSSYVQVYGKNYNRASGDKVAKPLAGEFATWMTTNNVELKEYSRALPETKTVNGVKYRFDGWYREDTSNDALPDEDRKIDDNFPVEPTKDELQNDVVNFFARYVPVDTALDKDQPYIIVEKEVKGLTDVNKLQRNFCIMVDGRCYDLNSKDGDVISTTNGFKIRWKIDNVSAGTHTVGEDNYTVNGYNVKVKVNGTDVDVTNASTNVNVVGNTFTVNHGNVITPNSDQTFDFGVVNEVDHIFAVSIVGDDQRNIIISKDPLSVSQRAAVVNTLKGLSDKGSNFSHNANAGRNEFYSLREQNKIVIEEGIIAYDAASNKVTISAKSAWNKVVGMSYNVETGNNPEVSITNTYTLNTTNVTITKRTTGAFADRAKAFKFTVSGLNVDAMLDGTTTGNSVNFELANGNSKTIENLTVGTVFTITEDKIDSKDYDTTDTCHKEKAKSFKYQVCLGEDGKIYLQALDEVGNAIADKTIKGENLSITVTNDFDGNPDTGVLLDTLPYLILLAVAVAGGVLVVVRKRKHRDE